ncbi:MAG: hypothetical protein IPG23_07660 [Burkholderiales bacterium]|nr:hypothetical protein [Burkholderiales bacterium]
MLQRQARSCTLILNDVVGNIRNAKSFGGWLLRMAGFAGDEPLFRLW